MFEVDVRLLLGCVFYELLCGFLGVVVGCKSVPKMIWVVVRWLLTSYSQVSIINPYIYMSRLQHGDFLEK